MDEYIEKEIKMSELEGLLEDYEVEIDSPDGYVPVSEFVDKGMWDEYVVEDMAGNTVRVNENHLFLCERGWVLTKDMLATDKILKDDGQYHSVCVRRTGDQIPIVDLVIDHENHRYYADGFTSHNTNVGKSALMCYLAGEMLKAGYNVLYISMEMAEEAIGQRIEANLLDTTTDDLGRLNDYGAYKSRVDSLKQQTRGRLFIKEYPTSGAHAGHFKNLIKDLKQKKKFAPDIVFIDYINICASSRYRTLNGVNSYSYVKSIAEEIRGLAVEEKLRIMTATQTNRDGFSSQAPDVTNTSESFGLPQTVDWMIAAITNEQLMEERKQIFHLLKTRFGNKTAAKAQLIKVDFDRMRYHDVDSERDFQATQEAVQPPTPGGQNPMTHNDFQNWNM